MRSLRFRAALTACIMTAANGRRRATSTHLLAIPFAGELAETYLPARFSASDYPRLIEADREVSTLAVGNVLAVFNWPERSDRYRRAEGL